MDIREYQRLAQRTSNHTDAAAKLTNGCLGLAGECGECCDILKKHLFQGHDLDRRHLLEELGDVMWYAAEVAIGLGVTLDEVAGQNIAKLTARYPDGFDAERSKNRP